MKSTIRALSLSLCAVTSALVAVPAEARIQLKALGGDVEINGYLSSEARAHVGSDQYLTQWIQRLQIEANVTYHDVGFFDEFSLNTVVRPEFDAAYYYGDSLTDGRVGRNSDKPSYVGSPFTFNNDPIGFGGFDFVGGAFGTFKTGGIGKIVSEGFQNPSWLQKNFEVTFNRTPEGGQFSFANRSLNGFPTVSLKNPDLHTNCIRCENQNLDALDVAMNNTDSSGRLYPFREIYADAVAGDWWFRVGKQQVVWGKTDFFRLQDIINPVDFGQHFFFDSFEDIRIPQWIANVQYKAGSIGPLTDNAFTAVWNFDEFQGVGLGNPTQAWAHPFAKDISTFALFNTFFSVEPCVSAATAFDPTFFLGQSAAQRADAVCGSRGPRDPRLPSGFGQPVGLNEQLRPDWSIENTEAGGRWEFRLQELHFQVSYWYGWNDAPVFRFHSVNVPNSLLAPGTAPNDALVVDLARGINIPINVIDMRNNPTAALQAVAAGGSQAPLRDPLTGRTTAASVLALQALQSGNAEPFYRTGAFLGGQTDIVYKQSHTPGLSFDYFEPYTGIVFRVESSWTFDQLVNNTRKANWVDTSDVMNWSIGFDRPTFIKFLNKDRTFFLSAQIFDTWYMQHEGDKHTGFLNNEHNYITTFFFQTHYMRDKIIPLGFIVWESASNAWVAGLNSEWLIDNHWSIKGGFHTIWGGTNNQRMDSGPFSSFIVPDRNGNYNPYQNSVLGPAKQGIGAVSENDEVFFQLKYQF